MKIDVRFRGLEPSKALREHAVRRLGEELGGHDDAVTAAFVRFVGDVVPRCQITVVYAQRSGTATLEEVHPDLFTAVDLAAARLRLARRPARPHTRLIWTPA